MASKRMRKPPLNIARIASKSNNVLHQLCIVADRIDYLDRHPGRHRRFFDHIDVDHADIRDLVAVEIARVLREDRVGDLLRRRAAIADIVFDAEILVRPAGIVAGRAG